MSTAFSFQAQLCSVMEALSKAAVTEISKLVEIETKMLKIEITRGRNEIASLTEKLQLMEKLLYLSQRGPQGPGRQDQDQDVGPGPVVMVQDLPQRATVEPDRMRPCVKSENLWSCRTLSTDVNSLHQGNEQDEPEHPSPAKEKPHLIIIKEEPFEAEPEHNNKSSENGSDKVIGGRRASDEIQSAKSLSHNSPFTDGFVSHSTSSSLSEQGPHWTSQRAPAHTDAAPAPVKGFVENNPSQSLSLVKNTKLHTFRNSATKRFGCLQCGKSFRCFSQLEIHQRSHTGEKPYKCSLCGKRYAQKGHLYTHLRTHTGEKPYRCPICGKGFIQKCTLDMHQRTHTGEKPFVCMSCGKGFTKNCNLKKHLAVHLDPAFNIVSCESNAPTLSGTQSL
ncbi:histone-lysine N-methyltransferase PRDM9 isoform X1 [Gouania willdenowi]|uniref:histone-lysine N-methyltransferase PRDM9 isoform X1 n=1 Tax=Gouania willdenowi TaxID=441366 RepID=UPI001055717E|nr:histone-lysine N-methyltransferase PRDM9-like isoform X1 [Gouania willdenowi]